MSFCTKCGSQVEEGAKFCGSCGAKMSTSINNQSSNSSTSQNIRQSNQRSTVYDGEIHKCPNCGATLSSFVRNCPECGYELRGATSTHSVQEFSRNYAIETDLSQKIDLVRSFVIPNTREDILEFAILASSNVDAGSYSRKNGVVVNGVSQQDLTDAWMAKFEQANQKANILLTGDPYLQKINKLFDDKKRELGNARKMSTGKNIFGSLFGNSFVKIIGGYALFMIVFMVLMNMATGGGERKLEKQVKQVEAYIEEGNYDAALTTAYAMSDHYSSSWSETRASLISRILDLKGEGEDHEGMVKFPTQTLTGKQVSDVVSMLESAGFTNITQEKVKSDLLTGWMDALTETKGEVEEVTVNGSKDYSQGAWMDPNTPIIVRYW